ncbi:hypothetical protein ACRRTK_018695 [Alexandromys fortis]
MCVIITTDSDEIFFLIQSLQSIPVPSMMPHFRFIIQKQMARFYRFPWWGTHCVYLT